MLLPSLSWVSSQGLAVPNLYFPKNMAKLILLSKTTYDLFCSKPHLKPPLGSPDSV